MKLSALKYCVSPKHIGKATWVILQQNIVTPRTYLIFVAVELLMMMFYAFTLVARVHFQNFPDYNSSQEQGHGISLAFMRDLDTQLQGLVAKNDGLLFALTITILLLASFIVGAVLWKAAVIKSH